MPWTVYLLECADSTLYTGITNDMQRRLEKHAEGTGAKYTKGRAPYKIVYTEMHETRSHALKRELAIKALARPQKLALAQSAPAPCC